MSDFVSAGRIAFISFMAMLPPTFFAFAAFWQTRIIHSLVNSRLETLKGELVAAKTEIIRLEELITNHSKSQKP